jgi:hypothetical protein
VNRFFNRRTALAVWVLLRVGERIARKRLGGAGGGRRRLGRRIGKIAAVVFLLAIFGGVLQRRRGSRGVQSLPEAGPEPPPPVAPTGPAPTT